MNECHKCHKNFNSYRHLKYHLAFNPQHKDDLFDRDDYTCPECDEDLDSRSELQEHLEEDHDDDDGIRDILSIGAGIVMGAVLGSELEEDNTSDDNNSGGDDFGGFSGGDSSGGGASSDW